MSPAGGGAQELGVPLGAVAGRVGGSLQAVGLDGGCSPWGLAWERLVERPAWGCGAEGMALCPACNGACSAAGRAQVLQGKTETSLCLVGFGDWEVQCNGSCLRSCVLLFCKPAYWGGKSS